MKKAEVNLFLELSTNLFFFQVIAESVLQRTRRLLAAKGIADFEKTHVQVSFVEPLFLHRFKI